MPLRIIVSAFLLLLLVSGGWATDGSRRASIKDKSPDATLRIRVAALFKLVDNGDGIKNDQKRAWRFFSVPGINGKDMLARNDSAAVPTGKFVPAVPRHLSLNVDEKKIITTHCAISVPPEPCKHYAVHIMAWVLYNGEFRYGGGSLTCETFNPKAVAAKMARDWDSLRDMELVDTRSYGPLSGIPCQMTSLSFLMWRKPWLM